MAEKGAYKRANPTLDSRGRPIIYYWVGKTGYLWSYSKERPTKGVAEHKWAYMGFTTDLIWPKKMNTGRLLQSPYNKKPR